MTLQLMLDADVIIDLHELELWNNFISKSPSQICLFSCPTIIEEANYDTVHSQPIDLSVYVSQGTINEVSASAFEVKLLIDEFAKYDITIKPNIDNGEKESMSILKNKKYKDIKFCTCDKSAIYALGLIGLHEQAISLESILNKIGLSSPKIYPKDKEKYFRKHLERGVQKYIESIEL